MNIIANPGVDKSDFELWSLAVSAINGCGTCINNAHEKGVEGGERAGRDDPDGRAFCRHHLIDTLALEPAAVDMPVAATGRARTCFPWACSGQHRRRPTQPARTLFRSDYSILLVAGARYSRQKHLSDGYFAFAA
jgi:AhpD family alkylhydroperoxidase